MLRIGMFIADRYEILEHIGTGGMSEVYKAKCHKLNRFVAIKVLKKEFSTNPDFVAKFRIEAQSAAILSHPNIVSIFDVGDEQDIHYIVMELIEGITLKDYIANKGKLDVRESVGIAIQVAQGLAAAHDQHIIHRDIKPQNIIISKDAKVKVMDFGIARAASGDTINPTTTMGSVHYISPEQARGGYCDERSDIYSLGITLYEMIVGSVPFDGENTVAVALAHIQNPIKAPRESDPSIPISLEKIVLKCTEKKAERRYSSVMELIGDLRKSLISPDDDFVKVIPSVNNNPTKMLNPEEVEAIRNGAKAIAIESVDASDSGVSVSVIDEDGEEIVYNSSKYSDPDDSDEEDDDDDDEDDDDENAAVVSDGKDSDDEKENSPFDIIVFVFGILLAIVIIVLAILLGVKILEMNGIQIGTIKQSITGDSQDSSYSVVPPSSVNDKQVQLPDLTDMKVDEAEKLLKTKTLTIKIEEEYSEEIPEGTIISQKPIKNSWCDKYSTVTVKVSKGSQYMTVPDDLVGKSLSDAQYIIFDANLYSLIKKEHSDTVPSGYVIRTVPASGETIEHKGIIEIYVSLGKEILYSEVPNLVNMPVDDATKLLEQKNLNLEVTYYEENNDIAENCIIRQDVEVGTNAEQGTTIHVVVSKGAVKTELESVVGKSLEEAKTYLEEELGLKVIVEEKYDDTMDEGKVISQSLDEGTMVSVGMSITIVVSSGSETVRVPNVINLPKEDAMNQLSDFNVSVLEEYSDTVQKGLVISQSLDVDSIYNRGSTILITVSKGVDPNKPTPSPVPTFTPTPVPEPETAPSEPEKKPEKKPEPTKAPADGGDKTDINPGKKPEE